MTVPSRRASCSIKSKISTMMDDTFSCSHWVSSRSRFRGQGIATKKKSKGKSRCLMRLQPPSSYQCTSVSRKTSPKRTKLINRQSELAPLTTQTGTKAKSRGMPRMSQSLPWSKVRWSGDSILFSVG